MYQELLNKWIKSIPSKENRKYLKNSQELKVFAEWLDEQAANHELAATWQKENHVTQRSNRKC